MYIRYHLLITGGPKGKSSPLGSVTSDSVLAPLIEKLGLDRPIIVSPSMSGGYSLPYIIGREPEKGLSKCRGFVPVAPVATGNFYREMPKCEVRRWLLYFYFKCCILFRDNFKARNTMFVMSHSLL